MALDASRFRAGMGIIMLFVFVLSSILFFTGCVETIEQQDFDSICSEERCWRLEIARTEEQRVTGLMGRQYLQDGYGMLFVFDKEDHHGMWMKGMEIPLDMIWLDHSLNVVHVEYGVMPCTTIGNEGGASLMEWCKTYKPDQAALYVLEVNSNEAKDAGVAVGSYLTFASMPSE